MDKSKKQKAGRLKNKRKDEDRPGDQPVMQQKDRDDDRGSNGYDPDRGNGGRSLNRSESQAGTSPKGMHA